MYFMGPNTFSEPWYLPHSPPEQVVELVWALLFSISSFLMWFRRYWSPPTPSLSCVEHIGGLISTAILGTPCVWLCTFFCRSFENYIPILVSYISDWSYNIVLSELFPLHGRYEDAFNRFVDEINGLAAYQWWEGSVYSILSVLAYPLAWSWLQQCRKRKLQQLREYVRSEYDHACLRSCRSRALYEGLKVYFFRKHISEMFLYFQICNFIWT